MFVVWSILGSLEIDQVTVEDQGSYRCNASSSGLFKLNNKSVLTVNTDISKSFLYYVTLTGAE